MPWLVRQQGRTFVCHRELALMVRENSPELKQLYAVARATSGHKLFLERASQARSQVLLGLIYRIIKFKLTAAAYKRVAQCFSPACPDQQVANLPAQGLGLIHRWRSDFKLRHSERNLVIAVNARHFLNQILRHSDITRGAPTRYLYRKLVTSASNRKPEPCQNANNLRTRNFAAQPACQPGQI